MATATPLTTTLVPADTSVTKTEVFDVEMASWILENKDIHKEEKEAVRKLFRGKKRGNQHDTTYKLGRDLKNEDVGRYFPLRGTGLQCCWADTRAALAKKYYWDVDMRNAQATLLEQYARKRGWTCDKLKYYNENRDDYIAELMEMGMERWEAKEKVCRVMFGGSSEGMPDFFVNELQPELRKLMENIFSENKTKYSTVAKRGVRTMMACVLQTEERLCLMAMDTSLAKQGRSLDVLIHDGGLVRKKDGETAFPVDIMRKTEKDIQELTGYSVSLAIKELKTSLSGPSEEDEEDAEVIDDAYAARRFCDLMGDRFVADGGLLWVFNSETGMWSCDKSSLERVITSLNGKLVFRQTTPTGVKTFDYSGSVEKRSALIRMLPSVATLKDGWMRERIHSDANKLLFPDGIYDFETDTFTPQFDPNIVFTARMPRKFCPRETVLPQMEFIRTHTFAEPFNATGDDKTLLHELMRAALGDFTRKKAVVGLGPQDCSKGMTTQLTQTAFGSYVQPFNGNSLLHKGFSSESEREFTFVMKFCQARFAFSSEIRIPKDSRTPVAIDGNLFKTLVSGGDEIQARRLNENPIPIVNKAQLFIFANDMPTFSPASDDVSSKIVPVNWSFSFVEHPMLPTEKKRDPEMSKKYKQAEYGDAFFWIIVDEYKKWKSTGFKEIELPETARLGLDDLIPIKKLGPLLMEEFVFTKSTLDAVPFDDIADYVKSEGWEGSTNKLGRELTALGLGVGRKREKNKITVLRTGLRRRAENQ